MSADFVVGFARSAIEMTLMLALPMLGIGLLVGLMVGIFQATTQIQEMTLTFIPKIVAVFIALIVFAPWILGKILDYTANLIINIPTYIR
ncbi:MAG: flagellar biosynthesis protein FliQ [Deltaproteobacteria bacterium]|nr:flagellar biosynthesis protein FliQ [Deltaproteobacteria bacterium]